MKKKKFLTIVYTLALLLFFLCMSGCGNVFQLYPIQGKWRVDLVKMRTLDNHDSSASENLGYLVFNECQSDSNEQYACQGERIYGNNRKITFPFQMLKGASDEDGDGEKQIEMARKGDTAHEFSGLLRFKELDNNKMTLYCKNCQVGGITMISFELYATKIEH